MTKQKYEPINNQRIHSNNRNILAIGLLSLLCIIVFVAVFATWSEIYSLKRLSIPQKSNDIPALWQSRLNFYIEHLRNSTKIKNNNSSLSDKDEEVVIQPSKLGSYIYSNDHEKHSNQISKKLICYYTTPRYSSPRRKHVGDQNLNVKDIVPGLCTHINIGIIEISNCSLVIDEDLIEAFKESNLLKLKNNKLKVLLWVGGADESTGFSEMVLNHSNRKKFIQSLKATLEKYSLDGIDLDWEFPDGSNPQRIHFMQLLHEIRREYQREHSTYLLSLAAAAPSALVEMCYDIPMINENVDYVNLMTYDYHFYAKETPYVGLNAPLYSRSNEVGFFATLNINYSVNYWISKGLDRSKIIMGLPTYGHSFRLVNPFNTRIGAPAEDNGDVGSLGFPSYPEVCWFQKTNFKVKVEYDSKTCSPFLSTGLEWISYEDERSLECKANYAKDNHLGGVMVFSLNADDYQLTCDNYEVNRGGGKRDFPLLRKIHSILFHNATN